MSYSDIKLSVIVAHQSERLLLEQCLCSVRAALSGMDVELYVIDLSSACDVASLLRSDFPDVNWINNEQRLCRAAIYNQVIRQAAGEYVLLLRSDTLIGEEELRSLCFLMDDDVSISAIGVKMLDAHGRFIPESKRAFLSSWLLFCEACGLSRLFSHIALFSNFLLPGLDADKQHDVELLSDVFMLLRHERIDGLGGFDESLGDYGADMDLSYRLSVKGDKVLYIPERILYYNVEKREHIDKALLKFNAKHCAGGWLLRGMARFAFAIRERGSALFYSGSREKAVKHRRLLVFCEEAHWEKIKQACARSMPDLEFINHWNLDEERVMDAICRKNQMKGFTDYAFCFPDVRFEQMFLFMDKLVNKKAVYHIYTEEKERFVSI